MPLPIVLDCDPGHDDAVAILLAAGHEAIDLRAITTVAGNGTLERTTINARRVAALAELDGVPIAAGAAGPARGVLVTAPDIHGETGLDGYDLHAGEAPLDPRPAVDLLADTLAGEPMTVVATGPLTNVAALLEQRPEVRERIREIVWMGGSTGRGNTTPAAEFNAYVDPEAVATVFESGLPVTMIGLNLTHQARVTRDVVDRIRALGTPASEAVAAWMEFFGGGYERIYGEFAPPLHDPCTIALLIDPTLIRMADTFVAVELEGRWTRGATVVDLHGRLRREPNARVALELDAPRFWDLLVGTLGRMDGSQTAG
jgi:purine nucleosidase